MVLPRWTPPPRPVILFNRAEPPALILASRRSFLIRACSAALSAAEEAVSAMLDVGVVEEMGWCFEGKVKLRDLVAL